MQPHKHRVVLGGATVVDVRPADLLAGPWRETLNAASSHAPPDLWTATSTRCSPGGFVHDVRERAREDARVHVP
ncbi:hypothetical protein ACQPZP_27330 [Spirillospora sp. CA-142024]|uniref:hypothetical protein n=1 Tax=Spirillospora sp. CA-142024 TaxID=3240036 RepID=UPI003D8A7D99